MRNQIGISLSAGLLGAFTFFACSSGGSSNGIPLLPDSDGDGLPDGLELSLSSDPLDPDDPYVGGAEDLSTPEGPGIDNIPDGLEQFLRQTSSTQTITARTDTDFDGIPDYAEVQSGLDHLDFDDPVFEGNQDLDSTGPPLDGVNDGLEIYLLRRGAERPVTVENDSDGDGFEDVLEIRSGTDPFDGQDPFFIARFDVDGDGLSDAFEVEFSTGVLDPDRPLSNGGEDMLDDTGPPTDGITDALERHLGFLGGETPVSARDDADLDGIPDYLEARSGSNIIDVNDPAMNGDMDSDGDGISDGLEDLMRRSGAPSMDMETDFDSDRISDFLEILTGSDPFDSTSPAILVKADIDLDGVPDVIEILNGSDPEDRDSPVVDGANDLANDSGPAGDSISDALEQVVISMGGTSPVTMLSDTDEDGIADVIEILFLSDLTDADSPEVEGGEDTGNPAGPPGDGVSDALEALLLTLGAEAPITAGLDSDGDSIPDVIEVRTLTDPLNAADPAPNKSRDVDGDGAVDYLELIVGSNPLEINDPAPNGANDTDGDGLTDGFEEALRLLGVEDVESDTDSDGDGLFDPLEVALPSDLLDRDDPIPDGGDSNDETGPAGDGVSDALEHYLIANGVLPPVTPRSDSDVDGIPDIYEAGFATNFLDRDDPLPGGAGSEDGDGDGIIDGSAFVLEQLGAVNAGPGTDLDMDLAPDYLELRIGSSPLDAARPAPTGSEDLDGDNIPESVDALLLQLGVFAVINGRVDSDFDGAPDVLEVTAAFDPAFVPFVAADPRSVDRPVVMGGQDTDDGAMGGPVDAISDAFEQLLLALGVAAPIDHGTDTDGDLAPDYLEVFAVTDLLDSASPVPNGQLDSDDDLLSDALEAVLLRLGGQEPLNTGSDTDGDGIPDYFEVQNLAHPVDIDYPLVGGAADTNDETGPPDDGISDAFEAILIQLGANAPLFASTETDGDGLPDYLEVRSGSDPFDGNSPLVNGGLDENDETGPAGDGISDALEAYLISLGAIGPITLMSDSDLDGVPDSFEILRGTDPFDPESTIEPGDIPEALDVRVSGAPFVGGLLSGSFSYFDPDNDPEGESAQRWLRNGVEIPGETSQHLVVTEDLGAILAYEVTPVSSFAFPPDSAIGDNTSTTVTPGDFDALSGDDGPAGYGVQSSPILLELWLRADRGIVTLPDGSLVQEWRDNARIPTDAVAFARDREPVIVDQAGPPGLPAVRFTGGQTMELRAPVKAKFTLAVVARTTDGLQTDNQCSKRPAMVGLSTNGSNSGLRVAVTEGVPSAMVHNRCMTGETPIAQGEPHLFVLVRDIPSVSYYVDGFLDDRKNAMNADINIENWLIGSGWRNGGFFTGDIYEVIAVPDVMGVVRKVLIDNYYSGLYGIRIDDTSHYAHLATHKRDICGIGFIDSNDAVSHSQGTGPVLINNPSALSMGDFLLWGRNGTDKLEASPFGIDGYPFRLSEEWALTLTDGGNGDGVGLVDMELRLGEFDLLSDKDRWALVLVDTDSSTTTVIPASANNVQRNAVVFPDVDLNDTEFFTFAIK